MKLASLAAAAFFLTISLAAAQSHDGMDPDSMNHDTMNHGAMDHDTMNHGAMDHGQMSLEQQTGGEASTSARIGDAPDDRSIAEGGQAAFAAIQEIVYALMADPDTDWSAVDIEALRQHLIDMDNVTLRAQVAAEEIDGGARFLVTSDDPAVAGSIRRMTLAHARIMNGAEGWTLEAEEIPGGASLAATGDAGKIRGLGFIGLMAFGMHHQSHHLALAQGVQPH
jgi:pentapeptide MXKDX repeat protein